MKLSTPLQVILEVTSKCDQNCIHCFANSGPNMGKGDMTTEQVCGLIDEFVDQGVLCLAISGGEPMLRGDIFQILNHLSEYSTSFSELFLLTNLSSWTKETTRRFISLNNDGNIIIQTSLDSLDPNVYAQFRGTAPTSLNRVISTMKMLTKAGIPVHSGTSITSLTKDGAIETARYAVEEIGVYLHSLISVYYIGRARGNKRKIEVNFEDWRNLVVETTRIRRDQLWGDASLNIRLTCFSFWELYLPLVMSGMAGDLPYVMSGMAGKLEQCLKEPGAMCTGGTADAFIDPLGNMYPCLICRERTECCGGNVFRTPLEEIWSESEAFRIFRDRANWQIKGVCKRCSLYDICYGGCRAHAAVRGDLWSSDPDCPIVQNPEHFERFLS